QWLIHSNVAPTATADGFTWQAANGQQVQVTTLLPAEHTVTTYSDKAVLGPSNNFLPQELKGYQTRISPVSTSSWQTFLNVVQSGAKGTVFSDTLVKATDDSAEGTLVHRAGQSDTLVLFGALQAGRVLEQGYTVHYTASTSNTQVDLTDLDPSKSWTISINGGPAQQLTVSSQGVASFTVQGAGDNTFRLASA
ncbi:MAG TPA: hypothetical protein VFA18_05220, partial [Gemmataceae bacterium]|nr:hypothetical protein [Gemmataceae bacterium]